MNRLLTGLAGLLLIAVLGCALGVETPEARYEAAVRARAAFESGDLGRARSLLRDLADGSRDADAWANLGLVQREAGDRAAAERAWSRAVEIDRACARAWYWLGVSRHERATELQRRAQTDARHADRLQRESAEWLQKSAEALEAAAAADPAEPIVHQALGLAYADLGQPKAAERARSEADRLDPSRLASLAGSGLGAVQLPPRPRPTTTGQIPMRFAAEALGARTPALALAGLEGDGCAGLLLQSSATVLHADSLPEGVRWTARALVPAGAVAASVCTDVDGDGRDDLVFFTVEDEIAASEPDAPAAPAAGSRRSPTAPRVASSRSRLAPPATRTRAWWLRGGAGAPALLGDLPYAVTIVRATDLDHDGDPDLVLVTSATPPVRVWANTGGRFDPDVAVAGIDGLPVLRDLVCGDFNGDGRADLVAADRSCRLRVLVQRAGGGFANVSDMAGFYQERARALAAADMDGDGRTDLLVANDQGLWVYANRGAARFVRQAAYRGPQTTYSNLRQPAVAVAALFVTDLDNDGSHDVVTLHPLTVTRAPELLAAARPSAAQPAARAATGNEAAAKTPAEDTSPEPPLASLPATCNLRLWRNDGRGVLLDATEPLELAVDTLLCTVPVVADFDRDGDRDLAYVRADSAVVVQWNGGGNANRRLLVEIAGTRAARDARGARLELHAGDLVQSLEVETQPVWLGIRQARELDVVRIVWPDGSVESWLGIDVPASGRVQFVRGLTRP